MNVLIIDPGQPESLFPLTCTRSLAACPVGNRPISQVLSERAVAAGFEQEDAGGDVRGLQLMLPASSWLSDALLVQLAARTSNCVVVDAEGIHLAWIGESPEHAPSGPEIAADADTFAIRYPWDVLRVNELVVGALTADAVRGQGSSGAEVDGILQVGEGTRILPGVFVEGKVMIGRNCKIGPNCYLRGNTSIGDNCHIGQAVEVKNSLIMSGSSLGHLSYCGDSVIGENVNFGAGTIVANLRHDGKNHRSMVEGELIDTGRRKFGCIIGDDVHTGIHTSIYPGRKLWPGSSTRPGEIVKDDRLQDE
jgi:NDP-sugar pyrophosphorylase family protein